MPSKIGNRWPLQQAPTQLCKVLALSLWGGRRNLELQACYWYDSDNNPLRQDGQQTYQMAKFVGASNNGAASWQCWLQALQDKLNGGPTVLELRWLFTSFWLRMLGFDHTPGHVVFVVDEVAMVRFFSLPYFRFPLSSSYSILIFMYRPSILWMYVSNWDYRETQHWVT